MAYGSFYYGQTFYGDVPGQPSPTPVVVLLSGVQNWEETEEAKRKKRRELKKVRIAQHKTLALILSALADEGT